MKPPRDTRRPPASSPQGRKKTAPTPRVKNDGGGGSSLSRLLLLVVIAVAGAAVLAGAAVWLTPKPQESTAGLPTHPVSTAPSAALTEMRELEARAATDTSDKELALRLGQIYADQHRSREALAQLGRALKLDPNLLAARVARAEVWLRLRQPAKAVQDLEQVVGQAPNDAELQDKLAAAYAAQRDWKRAEQHWRRAVELAPQDSATQRALAGGLAEAGNASEALSAAEKATQIDAADGQNWRALGEVHLAAKRYPEAEKALRKAVQLRPDDAEANVLLARTLMALQPNEGLVVGEAEEVYGLLTRALTFDLHHREALLLLGKYYLGRNELDLAVPTLRRARESDPESAPAREALAEALVRRGDQEEGMALKKQSKS